MILWIWSGDDNVWGNVAPCFAWWRILDWGHSPWWLLINPTWQYFTDTFWIGNRARLTASMHIYPFLVVLELFPLEQHMFLLSPLDRVGSRNILRSLDWSGSALCSNERDSQHDRHVLESFSHSFQLPQSLQAQRLPSPCYGHLADLRAGAALVLSYSNDPGAMLGTLWDIIVVFITVEVGLNDSWIFPDLPTAYQRLRDSLHLDPKFLIIKRQETGCVRNISTTLTGKHWYGVRVEDPTPAGKSRTISKACSRQSLVGEHRHRGRGVARWLCSTNNEHS